ncbi:Uncharacterised protein [Klebsiella pneumoniae]|nr:Uncharacterised protein [Klebsiella pneumoniae]
MASEKGIKNPPTLYFWTRSSSGIAVMICSSATLNAHKWQPPG